VHLICLFKIGDNGLATLWNKATNVDETKNNAFNFFIGVDIFNCKLTQLILKLL